MNVSLKWISTLLTILCPGPSRYKLVETITCRLNFTFTNNEKQNKKCSDKVLDDNGEIEIEDILYGTKYGKNRLREGCK